MKIAIAIIIMASQLVQAEQFESDAIQFNPIINDVIQERIVTHDAVMRQIDAILGSQKDDLDMDAGVTDRAPASEMESALAPLAIYDSAPISEMRVLLIPKPAH